MSTSNDNDGQWKTWLYGLVAGIILLVASIASCNYYVDPFEIFGAKHFRSTALINERFLKVDHLLNSPDRYDGFLMGSSVTGLFDANRATRLTGKRFYNLSYMAGLPSEALDTLKTLQGRGITPKMVVMPIDLFQFREDGKVNSNPTRLMHPAVSGESVWIYKAKYLLAGGMISWYTAISKSMATEPPYVFNIAQDGGYKLVSKDKEIAADHAEYVKRTFKMSGKPKADVQLLEDRFRELQALKTWLDEQGIKSYFFFSPMNPTARSRLKDSSLEIWKIRTMNIVGRIPDFSQRYNSDEFFYDDTHYLPFVCDEILDIIFSKG